MERIFFSVVILIAIFVFQSCSTSGAEALKQEGGYWVLKTLKGNAAGSLFEGNIPSLEFDFEKNMINGSSGCNRYFGVFSIDGNIFKTSDLGVTDMLCIEENKEKEYLEILSREAGLKVSVEDGILIFKDKKEVVLEFEKGEMLTINAVEKEE